MPYLGDSMTATDWTVLVAVLAVVLAALAATLQIYSGTRQRRETIDLSRLMADALLQSQRREKTEDPGNTAQAEFLARAVSELSYSTDRYNSSMLDILSRVAAILEEGQKSGNAAVHQSYGGGELATAGLDIECSQVIRELAHSLGTPLAQIKAEALRLAPAGDALREESFNRIIASVDLCNSFISSFREIARISGHSSMLSLASLGKALRTTADVYMSRDGKSVNLVVDVPQKVKEYSNTYLLSILAPLVENAIEASPGGERVKVSFVPNEDSIVFTITNRYLGDPPSLESFVPGTSTKQDHEGMGLATVKRLVDAHRNGDVSYSVDHGSTTFTVRLPRRRA